jgi:hypothetical protein
MIVSDDQREAWSHLPETGDPFEIARSWIYGNPFSIEKIPNSKFQVPKELEPPEVQLSQYRQGGRGGCCALARRLNSRA